MWTFFARPATKQRLKWSGHALVPKGIDFEQWISGASVRNESNPRAIRSLRARIVSWSRAKRIGMMWRADVRERPRTQIIADILIHPEILSPTHTEPRHTPAIPPHRTPQ